MGNWFEPSEEHVVEWNRRVAMYPPEIRAVADNFKFWKLYRWAQTGDKIVVCSFEKVPGGAITIRGSLFVEFNSTLLFTRDVWCVDPNDLTECDVPTQEERDANILRGPLLGGDQIELSNRGFVF